MVRKNLEHNTKTKIRDLTSDSGARQEEGTYFDHGVHQKLATNSNIQDIHQTCSDFINPLHLNISIHILHTVLKHFLRC